MGHPSFDEMGQKRPGLYPPSQKATGVSPWMNAERVSDEASAKADTLRRVPPKNFKMPRL